MNTSDNQPSAPASPAPSTSEGKGADNGWTQVAPTEQGEYWHWNGDEDSAPLPIFLLHSGSTGKCFVSSGQLGLTQAHDCDGYGGWWKPLPTPKTPPQLEIDAIRSRPPHPAEVAAEGKDAERLLLRLAKEGGSIVSSDVCSVQEIADARACKYWACVDSLGFVLRPKKEQLELEPNIPCDVTQRLTATEAALGIIDAQKEFEALTDWQLVHKVLETDHADNLAVIELMNRVYPNWEQHDVEPVQQSAPLRPSTDEAIARQGAEEIMALNYPSTPASDNLTAIILRALQRSRSTSPEQEREDNTLRKLTNEVIDFAEGMVQGYDYLGTGSNSREADNQQREDMRQIQVWREFAARRPSQQREGGL